MMRKKVKKIKVDKSRFKLDYIIVLFSLYVPIFVLFHCSRLYGSLYQLFNETKRYHQGNAAEDRLYYGGLDPACLDLHFYFLNFNTGGWSLWSRKIDCLRQRMTEWTVYFINWAQITNHDANESFKFFC